MQGYKLISINKVDNPNWFELVFEYTDGSLKVVTVENISGLKDVYMTGLIK